MIALVACQLNLRQLVHNCLLFVEPGAQRSLLKSRPTLLRGGIALQVAFSASNVISAPVSTDPETGKLRNQIDRPSDWKATRAFAQGRVSFHQKALLQAGLKRFHVKFDTL